MNDFKQQALLAIETLRGRVRELEQSTNEPIAIVGYAARFPGAPNAEAFWKLLERGGDAITEIPAGRWDVDAFYDEDPDVPGKMFVRRAGFIDEISTFDAQFFGISPREATFMDPQHRLLLETAWQALEHASMPPADLAGSRTGVFMGLSTQDYLGMVSKTMNYEDIEAYLGTGTSPAAAIGRISYRLGFEGPAVTVDTACSSSLVAIHQASQALRAGECDMALAGGVNALLSPGTMINFSKAHMLAPDGHCKTFDAAADGYVRGEGCGIIVMKRLKDAVRDGDHIRAVIRGSAVNQDGASGGLTVPNGRAQQRVITDALRQAGVEPQEVDYLEAHGTGTSLGDPIEVQAAAAALGQGRDKPLQIGSVKTNIGHLEAASGIAGVLKVVMALEHELLPKHLHFQNPSPHIPWDKIAVQVVREATPWQTNGKPRIAGVSSFGFSGTNSHVVIEEAPAVETTEAPEVVAAPSEEARYQLLPLSARNPEALQELAASYLAWMEAHPSASITDLARTAAAGRSHLEQRAGFVVDSRERAQKLLESLIEDQPAPGYYAGASSDPPKTAWLFTGQGSQYAGMSKELFETQPVFRAVLEHCQDVLRDEIELPLLDVIFGDQPGIAHTSYAQPALFAVEMGLARLWQSWGLEADVVLGHSVGQYAAACVAGVFSLEDGLRLLARRGQLMGALPAGGSMAAIFTDAVSVEERLDNYPKLSVAAYNGANTVVSGPAADVQSLMDSFVTRGVRCEPLDTSHAFHSVLLEPALGEFEEFALQFEFKPLQRALVCNRTGKLLGGQAQLDANYWRRHARQPVQYAESIQTLSELGCKVLLEIGPQPVLTAMAMRAWPEGPATPRAIASMRRDQPDGRQIVDALAQLYVGGARPNFKAVDAHIKHEKLDLPSYPFQRRVFWPKINALSAADPQARGLLGSRRDLASGDVVFSSRFGVEYQPWLEDHTIYGTVVMPGTTYAALAILAADGPAELQEFFIYEPIIFSDKDVREVQVSLHTAEDALPGVRTFNIHSRTFDDREAIWSLNATGTLVTELQPEDLTANPEEAIDTIIQRLTVKRPQALFDGFEENDLKWGPTWRTSLVGIWDGEGESLGEIRVAEELAAHLAGEWMHPIVLDLCTGLAAAGEPETDEETTLFLPLKYERLVLRESAPRRFFCHVKWHHDRTVDHGETQAFDLDFLTPEGHRFGSIRNFVVKRAPRQALLRGLGADSGRMLYRIIWRELPVEAPSPDAEIAAGTWLLVGFPEATTDDLRGQLRALKQRTITLDLAEDLQVIDDDRVALDPNRPEHWESLLTLIADRGEALSGIVWQAAPASITKDVESPEHILGRLQTGVTGLLGALHNTTRTPLPKGLWIVTERAVAVEPGEDVDPVQSAFWGLGRTIAAEDPGLRSMIVDRDSTPESLRSLTELLITAGVENQLALRQRKCLVPRVMQWARSGQLNMPDSEDYLLQPVERGTIDQIDLRPINVEDPQPGYVQVRVQAAGLNFRDVLNVLGLYPGDPGPVGGELSGVVTAIGDDVPGFEIGQRVFGFGPGAFASRVNVPYPFLATVPGRLSAVEATTTPATMLTAGLAFDWAKPKAGERVLIHAASGGVGMAAIQIAQNCGAIVYATASRPKQKMLRDMGVEHIYDSRSTLFADQILADTNGEGVDVVLNSLTSEGFVPATVRATAKNGRFVEIAKINIWSPEEMTEARPDISYNVLALDEIMANDPPQIKTLMDQLAGRLESGELKPLPYQVYPLTEAKTAFRFMQQARHVGKIVLQMPAALKPREDRSYLVTGGLGALGLRTAGYLAQMGAGHLVLVSRREPDEATQAAIDEIAEQFRCQVHVMTADVAEGAQVADLLGRIRNELPPLGGVAHLAGVVDDALLPGQSWEGFRTVLGPKALGALHLDRLTRGDNLDFFLLYSSASSVLGSPGQANYASANALLDGLAAHRQAQGLPATSINWGPWGEAGMAASEKARANLSKQGLVGLKPPAALAAVSKIMGHGTAQVTVINANWQRSAKLLGPMRPPILEHVLPRDAAGTAGDSALKQLHQVPAAQRGDFLTEHLQRELQQILALAAPPPPESRFLELGMDSLMAVELRNRLLAQFGAAFTISSTVVFDYPTIRALAEYLANATPEEVEAGAPAAAAVVVGPPPTKERLQESVSELMEKLAPLRELGIKLQLNGQEVDSETDAAQLEQAILQQEAEAAAAETMKDAVLADEVRPATSGAARPARKHALLTGATGYIGGYLLRELLRSDTRVTSIVRCQTAADGTAKIVANLEAMGIWEPRFADLIDVVPGDVTQPNFGLAPEAYAALTGEVDSVFHFAASVRPWSQYVQLREPNIAGTRNIVDFVSSGTPKALHLPSPASVFARPTGETSVQEGEFPETPLGTFSGYGQSKWAAESLARQAQDRGAPVVIYRAGAVLGSSEGGYWSPRDLASRALTHSLANGAVPENSRLAEGVPVDVMARFIAAASADPSTAGQTFHLFNPKQIGAAAWTDLLSKHDIPARSVSNEEWTAQISELPENDPYRQLFEIRGTGINATLAEALAGLPVFDSSNFQKHLSKYDIAFPDYDTLLGQGWLAALGAP